GGRISRGICAQPSEVSWTTWGPLGGGSLHHRRGRVEAALGDVDDGPTGGRGHWLSASDGTTVAFPGRRHMETNELHRGRLIDHIQLVVRDLEASRNFYRAVFDVLGVPMGG